MVDAGATSLKVEVSFDKTTLFHDYSEVLVLATAKFEQVSERHSGAAVWVTDATNYGFTGVIQLPERFTGDRSLQVHLEYFAYQMNVHRRTNLFEGGSINIPKWDTGSRCTHIKPKVGTDFSRGYPILSNRSCSLL